MRREPSHRSGRLSQALYGSIVVPKERRDKFALVETQDGYEGWIAENYLMELDPYTTDSVVVSSRWGVFGLEGGGEMVLPFGSIVLTEGDGELFCDYRSSLRMILASGSVDHLVSRPDLWPQEVALGLLSSPYLWGGTSPFGYDCSGLVQAVFRRCGVELPRDSKDQCYCGRETSLEESVAGDLVFFPGHVAILLESRRIIHATRLLGMVVIESLDPNLPDYRKDLVDKITTVRRIK
jgi:gamma-D-glutamyl-L-lysine dipeptidyl-peptidase